MIQKWVIMVFLLQWCLSQTINGFDDVKFEAASVLAELFEQQGQPTHSKPILRKAIELSQHSVYWHCRLIFQLAVSDEIILEHMNMLQNLRKLSTRCTCRVMITNSFILDQSLTFIYFDTTKSGLSSGFYS